MVRATDIYGTSFTDWHSFPEIELGKASPEFRDIIHQVSPPAGEQNQSRTGLMVRHALYRTLSKPTCWSTQILIFQCSTQSRYVPIAYYCSVSPCSLWCHRHREPVANTKTDKQQGQLNSLYQIYFSSALRNFDNRATNLVPGNKETILQIDDGIYQKVTVIFFQSPVSSILRVRANSKECHVFSFYTGAIRV